MSKQREIRSYDYVNHPYEQVRDVLSTSAGEVFDRATRVAARRAGDVAAELRVNIAGLEVGTEIEIEITGIEETAGATDADRKTTMQIEWQAARKPRLFPVMRGELSVYPLTGRETQLDFHGHYDPPMGILGGALDSMLGHKFAEVSVHGLMRDVAEYLRHKLSDPEGT